MEESPLLIIVFKKRYDLDKNVKRKNYYINESAGIPLGFLLPTFFISGLVTLSCSPLPMGFLEKLLVRSKNEKASLLIPVGFQSKKAEISELKKKLFHEISNTI